MQYLGPYLYTYIKAYMQTASFLAAAPWLVQVCLLQADLA